jgi:Prp8 binding protein
MVKRNEYGDVEGESVQLKKQRMDMESADETAITVLPGNQELTASGSVRDKAVNNILQSPTVLLTGHTEAIYSIAFDPQGSHLASASMDRSIMLWDVAGESKNYNVLNGHKNGVLEVKWSSSSSLVSCSADKTVAIWDAIKGVRTRKLTDHSGIVNSCSIARDTPNIFASGSDDCTAIIWDQRSKRQLQSIYHDYQITSVCMTNDGNGVYTGGIDNIIRRWDLRMNSEDAVEDLRLDGHTDVVTGLALSPNGNHLLSNSMDASLHCWDVKPFRAEGTGRWEKSYGGATHGAEKLLLRCSWSPDQEKVACGSADRMVYIWDSSSGEVMYYLPGHKGSVNEVIFHPTEPIVASCGSDKQIFLGELTA